MPVPNALLRNLKLPAIAAPMFLVSGPDLVVEVCKSGLIGTFPSLNRRDDEGLERWLGEIETRLAAVADAAPFGVNLIVHKSNPRFERELGIIAAHRVPLVITSLGAVPDVVERVHAYGGLVFHDVVSRRHAEKAAEAGVDGIIAVSAGAGGHAGSINPFALVSEIREVFDGTVVLGGAINNGAQIAAARVMGADMAYLGTHFIAARESLAPQAYKDMLLAASARDVVYTAGITGIPANFLRQSLAANGLDPDNLPAKGVLNVSGEAKAWRDIWSAGHGAGAVTSLRPAADICERLRGEYQAALARAAADPFTRDE